MNVDELISGKYYKFAYMDFIFKFEKIVDGEVFSSGYYLNKQKDYYVDFKRICFTLKIYDFFEIKIDEFVNYLPIDHLDRKAYFRRKKIDYLLCK